MEQYHTNSRFRSTDNFQNCGVCVHKHITHHEQVSRNKGLNNMLGLGFNVQAKQISKLIYRTWTLRNTKLILARKILLLLTYMFAKNNISDSA